MENKTIIEALTWRYATKSFDTQKKISDDNINTLLESIRLAPSSFGLQPWKIILVEDPNIREQLQNVSYKQTQITESSHLFVLARHSHLGGHEVDTYLQDMADSQGTSIETLTGFRDIIMGFINRQTDEEHQQWLDLQCYIALGFLIETAALLKIDSCPMEGFVKSEYNRILNLTEKGLSSSVVCPLGYRLATDKYAHKAKVRFNLDDIVIKV